MLLRNDQGQLIGCQAKSIKRISTVREAEALGFGFGLPSHLRKVIVESYAKPVVDTIQIKWYLVIKKIRVFCTKKKSEFSKGLLAYPLK